MKRLKRLFGGQSGQDMVEYGLLAAFISTIAISALLYFGPYIKSTYLSVQDSVRGAAHQRSGDGGSGGHAGGDRPSG